MIISKEQANVFALKPLKKEYNGGVAERSNATDCKSVDFRLRWFESIPLHH